MQKLYKLREQQRVATRILFFQWQLHMNHQAYHLKY